MRALAALLLFASAAAASERAFVIQQTARDTRWVHERFEVTLDVGFDRRFFADHSVPLFGRRMDLQAKLAVPWLEVVGAPPGESVSLAVNDEVVAVRRVEDRIVGGRPFTVLRLARTFFPEEPGVLEIPAPSLSFAWATRFTDDFISGRRPLDPRDETVSAEPLLVRILSLPEEGRPDSFTGAVGRFTVAARAEEREVGVGETLPVTVTVTGEGDLGHFGPPDLTGLPGFHVYGFLDDRGVAARTVTYELVPTDGGVTEIPAIRFAYFDPEPPGAYREVSTEPIRIEVHGARARPEGEGAGAIWAVLAAALVVAGAVALAARRRIRARRRAAAETPGAVFRARVAAPEADVAAAFTAYLADLLACEPAAVISPDLPARLVTAGVPEDAARRAAALVEEMVAARYGGAAPVGDARALVEEIEKLKN